MVVCLFTGCALEPQDSGVEQAGEAPWARVQQRAVVSTTDFSVGALAALDVESGTLWDTRASTSGDPVVVVQEDWLFQINRFQSDTVRLYDPLSWSVPLLEISTGAGSNPHDVLVVGETMVVSLYGRSSLALFDLQGEPLGQVDLSEFADQDGSPEPSSLLEVNGRLFVSLQQFENWRSQSGRLVEVDVDNWTVKASWEVGPSPTLYAHPFLAGSMVIMSGSYDDLEVALDGELIVFDVTTEVFSDAVMTEASVATHLVGYGESDEGQALLIGERKDATHVVLCLDWTDGTVQELMSLEHYLADVSVNADGVGLIAARTNWTASHIQPGVLVVDATKCESRGSISNFALDPYAVAWF